MVIIYNKSFLKAIATGIIAGIVLFGAQWLLRVGGANLPSWVRFLPVGAVVAYDLWVRNNASRHFRSRACFFCPSTGAHLLFIPIWILASIVALHLATGPTVETSFYLLIAFFFACLVMAVVDGLILYRLEKVQGIIGEKDIPFPRIRGKCYKSGDEQYHYIAMLAKVAKSDGKITKKEISVISDLFDQVFHTEDEKHRAIETFRELKKSPIPFERHARQFF